MKIHLAKSDILQGIQVVQKAVPLKSPMLNLQSVLLTAKDSMITFAATDMELGIKYSMPSPIAEEGSMLLPAKLFFEIIRRLPEDIIECESSGKSIVLRYADADFTLNGYDPEEYPEISSFSGMSKIPISGRILKKLIRQVSFACKSDDEKGGVFAGILVETDFSNGGDGIITLVATDTHRLAMNKELIKNSSQPVGMELNQSWIIPSKSLIEIGRLLSDEDEVIIEWHKESSRLNFKFNNIEVITRLIDGQYPNYKQVIPNQSSAKIIFDRNALLEAVERASLLSRDSYLKTSIVRFNIEEEHIVIDQVSEMGKIYEKVPVDLDGSGMTITFNIRYVIDALKNIETEKASMETSGPFAPCIFRPVYTTTDETLAPDINYVSLVLPLRH